MAEIICKIINGGARRSFAKLLLIICLIIVFFGGVKLAEAATLFFSPSSGSYASGQTFTVGLYVSSKDQAMNATQAIINFPTEKLSVQSVSKSGSAMTLWVQEPTYSNVDGAVQFAGVVPNPGFIGQSGKILSVTFKAVQTGEARLNLSKGSVLANDGLGTQILTDISDANFSIYQSTTPEPTKPIETAGTPVAPKISSATHPDPDKWYNDSNPKFTWSVPNDVTSIRLLYDKISNSQPSVVYSPAISEKQLNDIKDGIWYLHAQFKNSYGWGSISHFRFQIDTEPPGPFTIKFVDGKEGDNPRPVITLDATDALSGIDRYKIKISDGDFIVVPATSLENNHYILPLQEPGRKTILVQAFDKADNYSTASDEFTVKSINPPTITDYPRTLAGGETMKVKGTTYPDAQVIIWLQREADEAKSQLVKSDKDGNFTFTADGKLKSGIYKLWAEAIDNRGAKSSPSETVTIVVEKTTFLTIGSWTVSFLAVIIPIIALLILLLLIILYGWRKLSKFRKGLRKEVREAEATLHKAFDFLKEEILTQIKAIEKARTRRQLTEEEEKLVNRLKKDLDSAEKLIRKEIDDIKNEVE